MKKKTFSRKKFLLLWLAVYLGVLLFGVIFSTAVTYSKNRNLLTLARTDLEYYMAEGAFNPKTVQNNANTFVYDAEGLRSDGITTARFQNDFDVDSYASGLFSRVKKQGTIYRITFSPHLKNHIAVAIAMPMEDGGMFLFFKELPTLFQMLLVMFFSVTLLVIISAVFMSIHIRSSMEMERMQREYVDNVSHELKSPIASVRALTETLYDGMVKDEVKRHQYYGIMLTELNSLSHTVSGMLELSKIQSNQIDGAKRVCPAGEVFGDIIRKYSVLCENKEISFQVQPRLEMWPCFYTNQILAARLLDILLHNAVKFVRENGGIQVLLAEEARHVTVTVKDNGAGIAPEDQPHIFSRFYKSDKAHNEEGSGLGLAIAREIALCLNEKVWLHKSSPEGTEFCFTLRKRK